jgi:hypothetical protein
MAHNQNRRRPHTIGTAPTLEQKVAGALTDSNITGPALIALIDEVEVGIHAAEEHATRQRACAMDPARSPDLSKARHAMEDAAFRVGRLQTLLPRLEHKLAEVEADEEHARWLEDYDRVRAARDEAVEQFKEYPEVIVKLLTILHSAADLDAEISRVNKNAPGGENRRLLGVEETTRGITAFGNTVPSILKRITIPDIHHPSRTLWPPYEQIDPAVLAPPVAHDPLFSPEWGVHKDEQERAARENAKREREQFEKEAVVRQLASGAPAWWPRKA